MKYLCLITICYICTFAFVQAAFPPDIVRCNFGDTKCIAQSMQDVIKRYGDGNSAIGLVPINKIELDNITLAKADRDAPIQLNLYFKHLIITQLETAIVDRVVGFGRDIDHSKFEVYGVIPTLHLRGEYEASGKMLLLQLSGGGDAIIDLTDSKFAVKLKIKKELRDGKYYAKLNTVMMKFEPKRIHFELENIFRGNKEMTTAINELFNKNWKDVWMTVKEGVHEFIADVFQQLLEKVLLTTSYNEMFLSE